jgi:uncharacterized membrane protein
VHVTIIGQPLHHTVLVVVSYVLLPVIDTNIVVLSLLMQLTFTWRSSY